MGLLKISVKIYFSEKKKKNEYERVGGSSQDTLLIGSGNPENEVKDGL